MFHFDCGLSPAYPTPPFLIFYFNDLAYLDGDYCIYYYTGTLSNLTLYLYLLIKANRFKTYDSNPYETIVLI